MKNVFKYQVPPLLWIGFIYFLSSLSSLQVIAETPVGVDKVVHAIMFFVLCMLVRRAFYQQDNFPLLKAYALVGALIFTVVYGVLDEYHQLYVPGRVSDFYDVLADAGGALLYAGIWSLRRRAGVDQESSERG